jgi:hypothetical protein
MTSVTIHFDEEEASAQALNALRAGEFLGALIELDSFLRAKVKYASEATTPEAVAAFGEARVELFRICEARQIHLYEG